VVAGGLERCLLALSKGDINESMEQNLMIVRRLVLIISTVFCGSLALAAGAFAAGGGGGLTPGDYSFTSNSASAFFGGAKGGPPAPSISIFVNHGLNSFEPDGRKVPPTVMQSTMVQFTEFDPSGTGGSGCFLIADSDFTVSKNLQSAALHTLLTVDNMCKGAGTPVGGAPQPGPFAGGGGGGLQLPISIDVTWSGSGIVSTLRDNFTFKCLDHSEDGSSTFLDSVGGSASGTVGAATGLFTPSADVISQVGQIEIQGTVQPPCFGK
jgi:hypothetical protein